MIEINLLPDNLRKKHKTQLLLGGLKIPMEVIAGLGLGIIFLLIFLHVLFVIFNFTKLGRHKHLENQRSALATEKGKADLVVNELRTVQDHLKTLKDVTAGNDIFWSQKLNVLSDNLPKGLWLRRVELEGKEFVIEGSAISKNNDEMISVHKLISSLKANSEFSAKLGDFSIGSVQKRKMNNIEIADFVLKVEYK